MMEADRGLVRLINAYIDSGHIKDAIHYIDMNREKITDSELDTALKHWGEEPDRYGTKNEKVRTVIDLLENMDE